MALEQIIVLLVILAVRQTTVSAGQAVTWACTTTPPPAHVNHAWRVVLSVHHLMTVLSANLACTCYQTLVFVLLNAHQVIIVTMPQQSVYSVMRVV